MSSKQRRAIAISIGNSPDREKLGFPEREVQRVLLTICTALIRESCTILYAGDLRPGGYTLTMFKFLTGTYAGQGVTPFINVLPEPVVRRLNFQMLMDSARAAHGVAKIMLAAGGALHPVQRIGGDLLIGERGADRQTIRDQAQLSTWLAQHPVAGTADGFSFARQAVTSMVQGRVAMGGKMGVIGRANDQYEGSMPGIAEEAILSIEAGHAFIPLAAFGGATRDVAVALGLLLPDAKTPRGEQAPSYSQAMDRLQQLQDRIPAPQFPRLQRLANNDSAEDLAQEVLALFREWIPVPS
ncbi:hypothetical protein [Bradyrhizobium sp. Ai1a-2]|uniref:hypothetical protein n=1 Tax=Bradyrhizobium sp. Ai1a-2 TaxID=196490 RepID=UPI000483EB43|nr:hypothetical protein [Bradyrhizobium sp. Ai1a-2]